MILIIDNYDSFVMNIVHYMNLEEREFLIKRNDEITLAEVKQIENLEAIIISPGPMTPKEAGISNELISYYYDKLPILGICLGHQCIAKIFGCKVDVYEDIVHGETSSVQLKPSLLYKGLPDTIEATRYHSLVVYQENFCQEQLRVNAVLGDGTIMGIEHKKYPVFGVQFHPESILTGENGKKILRNFMDLSQGIGNEKNRN